MSLLLFKMTSPIQLLLRCVKSTLSTIALTWFALFVVNRLFTFQEVYETATTKQKRHIWMLESCMDKEFELNMQSHGDLCTKARMQKVQDPFTSTLHVVFDISRPCGLDSCGEAFWRSVDTVGLPIVIALIVVIPLCVGKLIGFISLLNNRNDDSVSPVYRENPQSRLALLNHHGVQGLPRANVRYRANKTFIEKNLYLLESNVI